ncbi:MAG: LemA family protein [Alphaproteobacteria bacterium]|nr:MAG: LemA family protein [Alphaproteobacteria bacterium]
MSFEDRITRMETSGKITVEQAEEMRASIRAMDSPVFENARRPLPMGLIAGIGAAAILAVFFFTTGGAGPAPDADTIQNVSEIMNQTGKVGEMSKNVTTGMSMFIILLPIVFSALGFTYLYNDLVKKEEDVMAAWSQVESNYQRRADLIPSLIETVKAYADHEEAVLVEVTQSRANAMNAMKNMDKKLEDKEALAALENAQRTLRANVTSLFGLAENYPQLRSADNFLTLQDQFEGTENRINVARMAFNETVRDYNSATRKMPGSLAASVGGFKRKAYFEADDGSEKSVKPAF